MIRSSQLSMIFACSALTLAGCSQTDGSASRNNNSEASETTSGGNDIADGMTDGAVPNGAARSFAFEGAQGQPLGDVAVADSAGSVTLRVSATGMPEGTHGIHLHEKGLCDGPKFESAGSHWNPASKKHGRDNPAGAHLGDLANITVGADGAATASASVAGAMMSRGSMMIADADGTSLVVHAKADDYKTDPSGDSGDRIACAVLAPPK